MKSFVVLATLIATASIAHADDYVGAGMTAGADSRLDWLYTGANIEGGHRLSQTWWLHGDLAVVGRSGYGAINGDITVMAPAADAFELRVGPEARTCTTSGALCLVGGADVGYRTGKLSGGVVVPRLGLDMGNEHLRFRPAIELAVGGPIDTSEGPPIPDVGIGLTGAVAYQW